MNYYEARERKNEDGSSGSGVWHFTCQNDDRIWPEGCDSSCTHATPEEACQHWVEVQIAMPKRRGQTSWTSCQNREGFDDEGKPKMCPNPARTSIHVGGPNGHDYAFCDDHAADNIAEGCFRLDHTGSFQITSSY